MITKADARTRRLRSKNMLGETCIDLAAVLTHVAGHHAVGVCHDIAMAQAFEALRRRSTKDAFGQPL